jgi:phosphate transport system substrate-binding protein
MKKIMGILMSVVLLCGLAQSAVAEFDLASEITVVSREDGSGTRGAFIELVGILDADKNDRTSEEAIVTNSTAVMMTTVSGNESAIGYLSLGSLDDSVKALTVDGVAATVENIKAGTYAVSRPFNIAVKEGYSDAAQDFINYILSAEGQVVVAANGYIALEGAPAYAATAATGKVVVAGSSSVTPVMEKLKEAYALINTNVEIEIQTSDSSIGMQSTIDGVCDIGMASRELKDSELEAGLTPTMIAIDGIAVIANLNNPVEGLTKDQIMQVFIGEVTTWAEVSE